MKLNYTPKFISRNLNFDFTIKCKTKEVVSGGNGIYTYTPSSYDYANKQVSNQDIIDELVSKNVEVIAITDHHFIDVERILDLQEISKGKITVLPGIEFLGDSRGKEPIHFIGIFSEDCNISHIWGQIENLTPINRIRSEQRNPNQIYCNIIDTCNLIKRLGGIITIHAGEKNNSIENITHSLPQHAAQKIDIANAVDIYELGKVTDVDGYNKVVMPFLERTINKRLPLILCSDNHDIKNYKIKQNLWIKGDPNFSTLKQLINQTDRAFIGTKPPNLDIIENNPTKYIDKLKVNKKADSSFEEIWFNNTEILLNPGLVAIIGNKGNGKSAITDILGLCGNTHNQDGFSFLNINKFYKNRQEKAINFEATLTWKSGREVSYCLSHLIDKNQEERIKYIPQSYLEKLCVSIEGKDFENELKAIIFSHIPQNERLGKNSLDERINHKTSIIRSNIEEIKSEISILNSEILLLEEKNSPLFLLRLNESLTKKNEELESHFKLKPDEIHPPTYEVGGIHEELNLYISSLRSENEQLIQEFNNADLEIGNLHKVIESLSQVKQKYEYLKIELDSQIEESRAKLEQFGLSINAIFSYQVDLESINNLIAKNSKLVEDYKLITAEDSENISRRKSINSELLDLQSRLDLPAKQYQEYLTQLDKWELGKTAIEGEIDIEGSIHNIQFVISYVKDQLKSDIKEKYQKRKILVKEIFQKKQLILSIYKGFYKSVTDFIDNHDDLMNSYKISFDTLFKENDLYKKFESFINFSSRGSFSGVVDGLTIVRDLFENCNFSSEHEAYFFVNSIFDRIRNDNRNGESFYVEVKPQLKSGNTPLEFYNFISGLDYLAPVYDLKLSNKNVSLLSPGERGALLLIFYLILDNNNIPLIIDQPEENLDNQSVYNTLVPFIKMAKYNRQVIIVTHNPNLAVVCDADQIIHVRMDKENKNEIFIKSGGLENSEISNK